MPTALSAITADVIFVFAIIDYPIYN